MMITFEIPGDPVGWKRPIPVISKSGKRHSFEDAKVKSWRSYIKDRASEVMQGKPLLGGDPKHKIPITLEVNFYIARPQRLYRKKDGEGTVPHTSPPDCSNLVKGVEDAMNGVVYIDDCYIWCLIVTKMYHAKSDKPHTIVKVEELEV